MRTWSRDDEEGPDLLELWHELEVELLIQRFEWEADRTCACSQALLADEADQALIDGVVHAYDRCQSKQ